MDFEIKLLELLKYTFISLKFTNLNLIKNNCPFIKELFWQAYFPILKYSNIKNFTVKLVSIFGTAYSCESYNSIMKITIKIKYFEIEMVIISELLLHKRNQI